MTRPETAKGGEISPKTGKLLSRTRIYLLSDKLPPKEALLHVSHPSLHLHHCAQPSTGWSHSCIDYFIDSVQPLQAVLSRRKLTSVACSSPKGEVDSMWKTKYCPWEPCSRDWNKFVHAPPDPCNMPWFHSVSVSGGTKRSLCTTEPSLRTK